MATKQALTVFERNDPVITIAATKNAAAIDLTGLSVEFIIKAKAADLDASGTILTSAAGDIVLTSPTSGVCEVNIPADVLAAPGKQFYRADVLDAGKRHTVLYGDFITVDV